MCVNLLMLQGVFFYPDNTQEVKAQVMMLNVAVNNNEQEMTTADTIKENVVEICGDGDGNRYKAITSTSTTTLSIYLKEKLNKNSHTDTDDDGIYDWNEINIKLIEEFTGNKTKISNSDLPTFEKLSDKMQEWIDIDKTDSSLFYVSQGYNQLINKNAAMYYHGDKDAAKAGIDKIKILPLISDPTKVDSDGDYMLDGIENEFVNKPIYWDIKDDKPLYAYANTSDYYDLNSANIYVKKTQKKPEEFVVKKSVYLCYDLSHEKNENDYNIQENETDCNKKYIAFPYELQEYMQSCCDTVIEKAEGNGVSEDRINFMKKYLTPELIMAVGVTESGWAYGSVGPCGTVGVTTSYTGLLSYDIITNCIGGSGACSDEQSYINIYCSVSGTVCMLAEHFCKLGSGGYYNDKTYTYGDLDSEQHFIYDILYSYANGNQIDYYQSQARITAAYKLYAFQEFCKVNGNEWFSWDMYNMEKYCDYVTKFTWKYNEPNGESNIHMHMPPNP